MTSPPSVSQSNLAHLRATTHPVANASTNWNATIQETSLGTPKTLPPPHVGTSSNSSDFAPQKALAPPSQLTPPDIVVSNP
mmetsp:Transcript_851/g.1740  ORF Transcript_851/g.1740 Transcript_851/m.1740 type:complete len:81 (+) Transcript_851:423-665(+)